MIISFYSYNFPFITPFVTAAGTFTTREGILIHVRSGASSCWAEASPLPGISGESIEEVIEASHLINRCLSENRNVITGLPSLAFAADCILWKLNPGYLNDRFMPVSRIIPLNAAIGTGNPIQILDRVKKYHSKGFRTFKFKVGIDPDIEESAISMVRGKFPGVKIRIDANCAWQMDTAVDILTRWQKYDIEYCEEPVMGSSREQLLEIRKISGVPLAADESVRNIHDARALISANIVDYLILKPTLIGRIDEFMEICDLAAIYNQGVVVTTALESGIGRYWVSAMASVTEPVAAMGLATGILLKKDSIDDSHLFSGGNLNFKKELLCNFNPSPDHLRLIREIRYDEAE